MHSHGESCTSRSENSKINKPLSATNTKSKLTIKSLHIPCMHTTNQGGQDSTEGLGETFHFSSSICQWAPLGHGTWFCCCLVQARWPPHTEIKSRYTLSNQYLIIEFLPYICEWERVDEAEVTHLKDFEGHPQKEEDHKYPACALMHPCIVE